MTPLSTGTQGAAQDLITWGVVALVLALLFGATGLVLKGMYDGVTRDLGDTVFRFVSSGCLTTLIAAALTPSFGKAVVIGVCVGAGYAVLASM
jgi:hypothetical protein